MITNTVEEYVEWIDKAIPGDWCIGAPGHIPNYPGHIPNYISLTIKDGDQFAVIDISGEEGQRLLACLDLVINGPKEDPMNSSELAPHVTERLERMQEEIDYAHRRINASFHAGALVVGTKVEAPMAELEQIPYGPTFVTLDGIDVNVDGIDVIREGRLPDETLLTMTSGNDVVVRVGRNEVTAAIRKATGREDDQ